MNRLRQLNELGIDTVWRLRGPSVAVPGLAAAGAGMPAGADRVAPGAAAGAGAVAVLGEAALRGVTVPSGWDALEQGVAACNACGLCRSRNRAVPGRGDRSAALMIVGDAPDAEEDAEGEPFAGQSGRLLDNMLGAIGLARGAGAYVTNIVKCRPPAQRSPQADEFVQCAAWLQAQVDLVSPRLILVLGRSAAQGILGGEASVPLLRGQMHRWRDRPVLVSYHPTQLLHTPRDKAKAWEDLLRVRHELSRQPSDRR